MRVRILQPSRGVMQGVSLSQMFPGLTYDLDPTLARYLMSTSAAVAAPSRSPALLIPPGAEDDFYKALGGISVTHNAEAADKPGRKRTAGRKKR
jgi:hypothetical protein